jgi:hypothetical protein
MALQNLPKIWIFGLKLYHLATLVTTKGKPKFFAQKFVEWIEWVGH